MICQSHILLCRAPCPALHHPCLAWRQAVLSQFSALETSGISLSVSQNSPKAPLTSHSCCMAASRRLHPEHPLGGGRNVGGTAPGARGFLVPGELPAPAENKAHFLTPKRTTATQRGQGHAGSSACALTLRMLPSSNTSPPHPRGQGTQLYPPQLAHTFSRIKQSTNFPSSIHSPAQRGHPQLRGEVPREQEPEAEWDGSVQPGPAKA